jgi:hypothetical protein
MADFPPAGASGILYKHYDLLPNDWAALTDSFEFEDGGKTFNVRAAATPKRWQVDFGALTTAQANVFDAFWDTYGIAKAFTFLDKLGVTQTGVRIESYSRSHPEHRTWRTECHFVLVKYQ